MSMTMRATRWLSLCAVVVAAAGFTFATGQPDNTSVPVGTIAGPYASLLAASTDLGPAPGSKLVQLVAGLHTDSRPATLIDWAQQHGLSVHWWPGNRWATVAGAPAIPHYESLPFIVPLDVPDEGLAPAGLLRTYNAEPLHHGAGSPRRSKTSTPPRDNGDRLLPSRRRSSDTCHHRTPCCGVDQNCLGVGATAWMASKSMVASPVTLSTAGWMHG
ncbi:Kumamolisin (fragment) [uncultured Mycobacterium sp.]|uniref:Kumamolisin n=1 Tax=uncultured Mycobacterium sp. TaxID=171292 RepID=A0A1Y5PF35_9MYCO